MISALIRGLVPKSIIRAIKRRIVAQLGLPIDLLNNNPWSSPNIWEQTIAVYREMSNAAIFEYGCGCSSLHHLRNLLAAGGGTYNAVEHQLEWFGQVCGAIVTLALQSNCQCSVRTDPSLESGVNFTFTIEAESRRIVKGEIRYRPPHSSFKGGEGNAAEFNTYVKAIGEQRYDLVVVDGRARKACVQHVLDQNLITSRGTLALFEAGRGTRNWLGKTTLTGDADYQPVVRRMLELGGSLADGIGLYSWPNDEGKLTTPSKNPPIPMESCFLTWSSIQQPENHNRLQVTNPQH
jgi:hypothetical protein